MTAVSVGVVSEGKTDFEIIKWSVGRALELDGVDATFTPIQPVLDRTSGSYSEGGWRKVYQWCLRNPATSRARFFGGGLFAGDEDDYDVIIVHLDGDIHQSFLDNYPGESVCPPEPSAFTIGPPGSFDFCSRLIADWLYGAGGARSAEDHTIATPAIMATEAWLIGGLGYHGSPDTIDDPKEAFARLWLLGIGRPVPDNIRRLKRNAAAVQDAIDKGPADLAFAPRTPAFNHAVNVVRERAG